MAHVINEFPVYSLQRRLALYHFDKNGVINVELKGYA